MRFTFALLAALSLSGLATLAHASALTITPGSYTLVGASLNSYSITGTVTLDSAGDITAANITFNDPTYTSLANKPALFNASVTGSTYYYSNLYNQGQFYIHNSNTTDGTSQIELAYIVDPNVSGDLTLTTANLQIPNSGNPVYPGISGSFTGMLDPTIASPTPEPSSLLLLGTGIMGLAGAARRRIRKA